MLNEHSSEATSAAIAPDTQLNLQEPVYTATTPTYDRPALPSNKV